MNILIDKVVEQLIEQSPGLSGMPEKEILMSFFLWSADHVLMESRYEETIMLNTLVGAARWVIVNLDV